MSVGHLYRHSKFSSPGFFKEVLDEFLVELPAGVAIVFGNIQRGGGRSSFAAPLASSQRVPGSTPGAALHLELLVTPLPLNLHKFLAEGCYTEVPAPKSNHCRLIIIAM